MQDFFVLVYYNITICRNTFYDFVKKIFMIVIRHTEITSRV